MAKIDTIDDLKAKISAGRGFASPALYYVVLPSDNNRDISFFAKSVQLPSRSLLSIDREIGTDVRKVAYGYQNPEVSMSFHVLNDQKTRQYFEDWQNSTVTRYSDLENHVAIAYPDTYMRSVKIYQIEKGLATRILSRSNNVRVGPINVGVQGSLDLKASGRIVYEWKLNYAYPITFSQETLSDDAGGTISQIDITFSYRNWTGKAPEVGAREITVDASVEGNTDIVNQATNRVYKTVDKILGRI
jgi:hypothetical protein